MGASGVDPSNQINIVGRRFCSSFSKQAGGYMCKCIVTNAEDRNDDNDDVTEWVG